MSTATPVIEIVEEAVDVERRPAQPSSLGSWLWRAVVAPAKYFVGVLLATTWLMSILVVGWTYRLMRRTTVKQWYKQSDMADHGVPFREYARHHESTESLAHWPNWLLGQHALREFRGETLCGAGRPAWRRVLTGCFGSLWQNLCTGLPAIANTWVLTMPICMIWMIFWFTGWNISFDKVYEEAFVGAVSSLAGIGLFIAVMHYLPMAQARHASTGQLRRFYDFRLVWKVARNRWMANALLAALYALLSIPIMIVVSTPQFLPQIIDGSQGSGSYEAMSDAEVLKFLQGYFFWCCAYIVPAYVLLHWLAARSYAAGLLALVRRGEVQPEELGPREADAMKQLGLLVVEAEVVKPNTLGRVVVKTAGWTSSRAVRIACGVMVILLWFSFAAQIYVGQFLNYREVSGWLNMPLIQLPWLKEIPAALL